MNEVGPQRRNERASAASPMDRRRHKDIHTSTYFSSCDPEEGDTLILKNIREHIIRPALDKTLFGRIQHTMDEISVKRTAGKIARYFLSRVVAIVICWLPSLFSGDQVVPKSDPPSTTFGIYPHRTTPGSPSPSTSIRCKRVAKSQPSQ